MRAFFALGSRHNNGEWAPVGMDWSWRMAEMREDVSRSTMVPVKDWGIVPRVLRVLAWGALLGASGLLVRGEVARPTLPEGVVAHTDLVYRRDGDRRVRLDV